MTKKDYIIIANGAKRALRNSHNATERTGIIFTTDCIAIELQAKDKKFTAKKFWAEILKK